MKVYEKNEEKKEYNCILNVVIFQEKISDILFFNFKIK